MKLKGGSMKKLFGITVIVICICISPTQKVAAQIPIAEIIKAAVKKVIVAVDLKVQRLQNETIWLQNAQKVLENQMSKLKLDEISDWANKQKVLYGSYFDELSKVKNIIGTYQSVKDIISTQSLLVKEYSRAFNLSKQDKNFTTAEIACIQQVYIGIIAASLKNIEQVQLVITAFATQMTDAKRLDIIHSAADNIEQNLTDLRQFNQQNIRVSLQRAKERNDIGVVKNLYGLK